jgi:tetratricopeptide (TPR) repeat protein
MKFGKSDMRSDTRLGIIGGTALMLLLPLGTSWGAIISPRIDERLRNIQLCNQSDRGSVDAQIEGCTALIKDGREPTLVLAIAHNNRGNAYSVKGDYDRAIQDYDEAIKLSPNYGFAYANRANTYQKLHEYARAVQDYDVALRVDPKLGTVWNGRCWARAIIGQLQAALTDCNTALGMTPNNAATLDSRGLTYLKMGRFDLAIKDYDSALRADPKFANALYGRGLAKLKKGDTAGGNADLAAAKALKTTIASDFSRYGLR